MLIAAAGLFGALSALPMLSTATGGQAALLDSCSTLGAAAVAPVAVGGSVGSSSQYSGSNNPSFPSLFGGREEGQNISPSLCLACLACLRIASGAAVCLAFCLLPNDIHDQVSALHWPPNVVNQFPPRTCTSAASITNGNEKEEGGGAKEEVDVAALASSFTSFGEGQSQQPSPPSIGRALDVEEVDDGSEEEEESARLLNDHASAADSAFSHTDANRPARFQIKSPAVLGLSRSFFVILATWLVSVAAVVLTTSALSSTVMEANYQGQLQHQARHSTYSPPPLASSIAVSSSLHRNTAVAAERSTLRSLTVDNAPTMEPFVTSSTMFGIPLAYGLTFHFAYLLVGFTYHGIQTNFRPSLDIASFFTASAFMLSVVAALVLLIAHNQNTLPMESKPAKIRVQLARMAALACVGMALSAATLFQLIRNRTVILNRQTVLSTIVGPVATACEDTALPQLNSDLRRREAPPDGGEGPSYVDFWH
jgi:hypothetical protein